MTFFFEGEEEAGSPTFRTFLETHRELLRADVIVVADSSNWKVGIPALTTSLRGLVDGTIEVKVLDHAVHSGMFGGPVLDAPTLLARLIATLHDDEGNVAIAGLVSRDDATVDLSGGGLPRRRLRARRRPAGRAPARIASRMWTKPALSHHRLRRPRRGRRLQHPPARGRGPSSACGSPPGRTRPRPWMPVRQHVEANAPFGAQVVFTPGESGNAFLDGHVLPGRRHRDVGARRGLGRARRWKPASAAPFRSSPT